MSFAHDVKTELCAGEIGDCCEFAQLYGMLLFGRTFSYRKIFFQSEHSDVINLIVSLFQKIHGTNPEINEYPRKDGHKIRFIELDGAVPERVFGAYGYGPKTVTLRINGANMENDCCEPSFLRGVFLSCGSVVDPGKDYHLEFVTPHLKLGHDLETYLRERDFEPKTLIRKGNMVVYFKDSGQIEDVLTYMGAVNKSLELMNVKIYKDIRNKANRVTNCETANIDKTVSAATVQIEAIKKIDRLVGIESLPADLLEIARLRVGNPELSLRELGELTGGKISRSGVNHRLKKIIEISEDI